MKNKERKVFNRYEVTADKSGLSFKVMKELAKGKKRTDSVKLSAKQIETLRQAAKKGRKDYFDVVDELIAKPCKIDSRSKKNGDTMITGYDPAHYKTAKALGISLKFEKGHYMAKSK